MEGHGRLTISQRLTIEQQLLREEKFIVNALKKVKEERFALQREGTDLLCQLEELLRQGKPSKTNEQRQMQKLETIETSVVDHTPAPEIAKNSSFLSEFQIPGASMDEVFTNEVELNLTIPSHNIYDQMPEEEFEDIETEDDFEVEMSMLMHSTDKPNEGATTHTQNSPT